MFADTLAKQSEYESPEATREVDVLDVERILKERSNVLRSIARQSTADLCDQEGQVRSGLCKLDELLDVARDLIDGKRSSDRSVLGRDPISPTL